MVESTDATQCLVEGRQGHKEALDRLTAAMYDELQTIAHQLLQKRPAGGELTTTALVHEAYLKLIDQSRVEWEDQAHFQALAARVMRHILIDHFREQRAEKRGGNQPSISLEKGALCAEKRSDVMLALDEALAELSEHDPRKGRIVMCRFFGGMTQRAIAEVLGVSVRTVRREWRKSKAWLACELDGYGICEA